MDMQTEQVDPGLRQDGTTGDSLQQQINTGHTTEPLEGQGHAAVEQEESFFDAANLPDELKPAYKELQGAFTKKMQGLSQQSEKVSAYDAFMQNPVQEAQRILQQYGVPVGQQQQSQPQQEFNPNSWDDVMTEATKRAKAELMAEMQPVLNDFKTTKQTAVESRLDQIDPQWRVHEDAMKDVLSKHPTLGSDPETLYRMSVPQEYLLKRATQQVHKKYEQQISNSAPSGGSSTTRQQATPTAANSFQQAIAIAKQKVAAKGLTPR